MRHIRRIDAIPLRCDIRNVGHVLENIVLVKLAVP